MADEVGEGIVGTLVIGGSTTPGAISGGALPGTWNVTAAVAPGVGAVVRGDPEQKAAVVV